VNCGSIGFVIPTRINNETDLPVLPDDPAEALKKPLMCDTPEKFAANYVLGYMKVRK
jgi:hypothetical protein